MNFSRFNNNNNNNKNDENNLNELINFNVVAYSTNNLNSNDFYNKSSSSNNNNGSNFFNMNNISSNLIDFNVESSLNRIVLSCLNSATSDENVFVPQINNKLGMTDAGGGVAGSEQLASMASEPEFKLEDLIPGFHVYRYLNALENGGSGSGGSGSSLLANSINYKSLGLKYIPQLRPSFGAKGSKIQLKVNHFALKFDKCHIFQYRVAIQPDKYPKKINRQLIEYLLKAKPQLFKEQKPVFDGRTFIYSKYLWSHGAAASVDLDVVYPGLSESKDCTFKISIKYETKINLMELENLLNGMNCSMPYNSIQALDVILRHYPSLK